MSVVLFEDQKKLKYDIYQSWARHRNVLAVLPTGGGKSVVAADIIYDGYLSGMKQAMIAHRNELVSQLSTHVARRGIQHQIIGSTSTIAQIVRQHRTIFNGACFIAPNSKTAVIGVDTFVARREKLTAWSQQIDRWMGDECFPAGTLVSTKNGLKTIEKIKENDEVLAFDEETKEFFYRPVVRLFKNPLHHTMFEIKINGQTIKSTAGHPFWTKRGWVEAKDLRESDDLYVQMHPLRNSLFHRKRASKLSLQQNRKSLLQKRMRYEIQRCETKTEKSKPSKNKSLSSLRSFSCQKNRKNLFKRMCCNNTFYNNEQNQQNLCFGKNENQESNAFIGNKKKGFVETQRDQSSTKNTRWKRKGNSSCRTRVDENFTTNGFYTSTRNKNKSKKGFGNSDKLQTRHGSSRTQNRNRSRRNFSFFNFEKGSGRQERYGFDFIRLESIEIYQPTDHERSLDGYVYNIEVDEFHTYVANGIVVHNCHHFLRENKWGKCVECFPNAQGIGFTATPCRADGQGLGRGYEGVFDDMVLGLSMRQLIDAGRLSDYEIVCPRSDLAVNEKDVGASGDWSSKSLKQASKESKIVGDTVENYCQYAFGRKAIVFATDVETAGEIARKFNATGIPAASVSAETNPAVREKFIEEFKSGKMMVLVNVDLFDEGFDVPDCGVVIMARPTASLGKYRQMAGRVLRYAPNKVALIIDQVSNVIRHGLPDKHVFWTLARADKRGKQEKDPDDIPLTTCLNCKQPYERFHVVCPHCGEEKPLPAPRERTLEMVDGDLVLLDRETLQRMRAASVIEAPADVGARVAAVAGAIAGKSIMNKQIEKVGAHNELRAVIEQWAGVERAKGFHDREIHKKFFVLSGMDVLTALDGSRPRTEMESISQTVKGWYER